MSHAPRLSRLVGAALAGSVLAMLMVASVPVSAQSGAIRACVGNDGKLSVIGEGGSCKSNESLLVWNIAGPAGPAGPEGPEGPAGPAGRDGRDATGPVPPAPSLLMQMTVDDMNNDNPTPIQSFSLGATNTGDIGFGGGGGTGKVDFQSLNVTKMLDGMSVSLLTAAATGEHIMDVKIEVFSIGSNTPFAVYTFEDVLVTAHIFGSSQNAMSEQVSFVFAKIKSNITVGGTTFQGCYDVKANKTC